MVFYCERDDKIAATVRRLGGRVAVKGRRMVIEIDHNGLRKAQLQAGRTVSVFTADHDSFEEAKKAWL